MKIERIQIDGFGCHQDLILSFNQDFNILYGKNESGKSTLLAFIQVIFYGFDDKPDAPASRTRGFWMPWQGGPFGGTLTFTHQGTRYTVLASWGSTKEDDRVSVNMEPGGKMDLIPAQTVGEAILQISCENFETFVLGLADGQTGKHEGEADQLHAMTHTESDCSSAEDSVVLARISTHRKFLENEQSALKKNKLLLQTKKDRLLQRDAEEMAASLQTTDLEAQYTELAKQETKPQSLDALSMSVSLLEKQKKVHKLYTSYEELRYQYAQTCGVQRRKKLPWTVVMIILMVLDAFALVTLVLPIKPLLALVGLGKLSSTVQTISCLVAVVLFLAFSLSLILIRTAGKRVLYEVEETLAYKEQALCELLNVEDDSPDEVLDAIALLDEQCKNATQCIAAIDRDRKDKAELERQLSQLMQQITYNRARQEMSDRLMRESDSVSDIDAVLLENQRTDARMQRHIEAIELAGTLLNRARSRQKSDLAPRLSQHSGKMLDTLTQGRYRVMELSKDFEPSVAKNGVLRGGKHYRGATGKQIDLALKLSQLQLLAESGRALPLILDEPFSGYDEERRTHSTKALLQFAKEHNLQVLITSSQGSHVAENDFVQYALSI